MNLRIYEERRRDREIREGKKDGIWYPPLGRQQSSSRKKAKRKLLPESESRKIIKETLSPRTHISQRFVHRPENLCTVEPLKGQYHMIFKIILQLFKFTSS